MFQKLFLEHPRQVGETYFGHMRAAASFGAHMMLGGIACMIHGLLPTFFMKTGSSTVRRLYGRMQPRADRISQASMPAPQFLPEYEI